MYRESFDIAMISGVCLIKVRKIYNIAKIINGYITAVNLLFLL